MKNKNSVGIIGAVLIIIALFIPTYIAIGAYLSGPNEVYQSEKNQIRSVYVKDKDGREYTYEGEAGKDMISLFEGIFSSSTKVSALTDKVRAIPAYTVKTVSDSAQKTYRFYFDPQGASYYEDEDGNAFGIGEDSCALFFKTESAMCLFLNTPAPELKNAFGDTILPSEFTWNYRAYDNSYAPAPTVTESALKEYSLDGAFTMSFDIVPDHTKVILYLGENVVYDGGLDQIASKVTTKSDTSYKMELIAEWYDDPERDYSGKAKYVFTANVSAQADFSLGDKKVEAGQIAVINGINIQDPSLIKITFTPSLKYNSSEITPVFYGENGRYSALVPIPASCFTDNAQSSSTMKYQIDIKYGDASYTLNLDVTDRTGITSKNGDANEADITANRTESALNNFSDLLKQAAQKTSNRKLWTKDTFFSYFNDGYKFSLAYGKKWQLAVGDKYVNEFIHYKMKANSDVLAVNSGIVVAAGENDLLGKYVAIDHGMGLQTWYLHLGDILVSIGDAVANEQKIAKSGSTGFVEHSDIGFSMMYTVNGIPVCPYSQSSKSEGGKGLEETGLNLAAFAQ